LKSVLHVLPHPGGGGETYVETLSRMEGYSFERLYLAPSPRPGDAMRSLARMTPRAMVEARKHDLVHIQGEVASGLCLPILALRPSIVTFNGLNLLQRVEGLAQSFARANLRLTVRAASRTICVSEAERREVVRVVGDRAAGSVVQIHNAVTLRRTPTREERAAARRSFGVGEDVVVGAWLAGLDDVKDPRTPVEAAIAAARSGSPLMLLMAGDGPLRTDLERIVEVGGVDAVRLLGLRSDPEQVLAAADFFLLSSKREGFSFALLEAMSVGLPAVVSDAPGITEAVGDAGLVAPRGDVAAFSEAFSRIASDESARLDLGARARRRVAEHFQADDMVRRTRELYDVVVE